jgi:hypothetical protein
VRRILRRDTINVVEIGKLLIQSRGLLADEHGQWQPWLAKNFDLSYRTAHRYVTAAEYVARKSDTVSLSAYRNLSPSVLYELAEDTYSEQEEAEILAEAKAGKRVDQDRASAICARLLPPAPAPTDANDGDDVDDDDQDDDADREIGNLLDGPPRVLPETEPATPSNFALRDFDDAVTKLKSIMTRPAKQFVGTCHTANDLVQVETLLREVAKAKRWDGAALDLEPGEVKAIEAAE